MASSSSFPSRLVSGFNSLAADPPASLPADSDLVVILAALLCALVCCVGLFAAVRCACLRRAASVSIGLRRSMPAKLPSDKGLKKKVLESLPKSTFTNKNNNNSCSGDSGSGSVIDDGNLTECAICLTEFVEGDELRILPHCGHGFHVGCIDMWLGSHSSCPSCRQNLGVSRCKKCGDEPPAGNSTGDIDLEIGGFKAAAAAATTTTTTINQDDDDDNRFLA